MSVRDFLNPWLIASIRTGTLAAAMHCPLAKIGAVTVTRVRSVFIFVLGFAVLRTLAISLSPGSFDHFGCSSPTHNEPSLPTTRISSYSPEWPIQEIPLRRRSFNSLREAGLASVLLSPTATCILWTTAMPSAVLYRSKSLSVILKITKLVKVMAATKRTVRLSKISVRRPGLNVFKALTVFQKKILDYSASGG